ncbi:DUF3093 domain-containing protein [Cellulomonas composti]|uniref:Membrane protein n=1 Tax=Cellulomonas composti TaxID=266130 RepID=A0A511J720_9CELL|nr:DUF3093 domain-containing protein [Cellulomonas composti]GEL93778.1 membrane protein [Cellulomonas composti]
MSAPAPGTPTPAPAPAPVFDERLWPGPGGWVAAIAFAGMLGIALVPVGALLGLVVGLVALVVVVVVLVAATPRVRVAQGELFAAEAHIPLDLLVGPRALAPEDVRTELGPALDARAYLCQRGWVRTAVRVELDDPADPTPYWIVSTRRPDELVAALTAH